MRIVKKMTLCCGKILSILLRGINSKSIGDFYHSNCLYSLRTKNQLESFKKAWENKIFCDVAMSSKDTKTFELNQYLKCDKMLYIIYADLESLIKK